VQKPCTYGYKHKNWQDYLLGAPDLKNHAGHKIFQHFPKRRPFWKMTAIFVQTRVLTQKCDDLDIESHVFIMRNPNLEPEYLNTAYL